MREIRFRAWNTDYTPPIMEYFDLRLAMSYTVNQLYKFQDKQLMQYTGLKDKNGKEIYEGDILNPRHGNAEVKFVNGMFGIMKKTSRHGRTFTNYMSEFEVIGNIHEHSFLLK